MAFRPLRAGTAWLVLAALALPLPAAADVTEADREVARKHMVEGRTRRDKKDLRGALESFLAADGAMHYPTTGIEVARTYADLGELLLARKHAQAALDIPPKPSDPPPFQKARERATKLVQELDARLPTLRIEVKGASPDSPVVLLLDDHPVDVAAASHPQPVDPGPHIVVARGATGEARQDLDLPEKTTKEVVLTLPPPVVVPPPVIAEVVPPPVAPAPSPPPPEPARPWDRTWFFTGIGVAAAGVAVGAATGLVSAIDTSSAKSGCTNGSCPPPTYSEINTARTLANVSNVAFIVGGLGAGTAIVAWAVRPKTHAAPPATGLRVTPWLGLGSAGASGEF